MERNEILEGNAKKSKTNDSLERIGVMNSHVYLVEVLLYHPTSSKDICKEEVTPTRSIDMWGCG
jgi:hypothetical protein